MRCESRIGKLRCAPRLWTRRATELQQTWMWSERTRRGGDDLPPRHRARSRSGARWWRPNPLRPAGSQLIATSQQTSRGMTLVVAELLIHPELSDKMRHEYDAVGSSGNAGCKWVNTTQHSTLVMNDWQSPLNTYVRAVHSNTLPSDRGVYLDIGRYMDCNSFDKTSICNRA